MLSPFPFVDIYFDCRSVGHCASGNGLCGLPRMISAVNVWDRFIILELFKLYTSKDVFTVVGLLESNKYGTKW